MRVRGGPLAGTLAACAVTVAALGAGAEVARQTTPPVAPASTRAATDAAPTEPARIASPSKAEAEGLVASAAIGNDAAAGIVVEVGRPIAYRIDLRGPAAAGARVDLDAFREAAAKGDPFAFDLVESTALRPSGSDRGAAWSMTLVVSTLDAGVATPPPLAIAWRADGEERRLELPLPSVEVASLVGDDAGPADFRDIAGELEPVPDAGAWWIWPIGAFALTTLAAATLALWMRRDRTPLPADRRALDALAALAARDLPKRREFGAFADELVRIVRAFTVERFAIPADRRTTRELLASLDGHPAVHADEIDRLRALLTLADRVKFARTEPDPAECAAHLLEARRFVEACASGEPVVPPTEPVARVDGRADEGRINEGRTNEGRTNEGRTNEGGAA